MTTSWPDYVRRWNELRTRGRAEVTGAELGQGKGAGDDEFDIFWRLQALHERSRIIDECFSRQIPQEGDGGTGPRGIIHPSRDSLPKMVDMRNAAYRVENVLLVPTVWLPWGAHHPCGGNDVLDPRVNPGR